MIIRAQKTEIEKIERYLNKRGMLYSIYTIDKQTGNNNITVMINAPTPTGFIEVNTYSFADFKNKLKTIQKEIKKGRYN